ncbi:MAG: hypothetical protein Q8S00_16545 [Deltaproteobacteria bacterium]|nr:hypothetical protein [Deltaproteobacteria bacterium]
MGFGVNAALNSEFKEYQLTHITKLQLIPNVEDKTLAHFKEEFKTWIEANGLRELIETYSVFLDALNEACLLIRGRVDGATLPSLAEKQQTFKQQGFPNKLNTLRTNYAVGPKHADYVVSLNKARNCLTHRHGIVGKEDVDSDDKLKVSWLGMDMFVETPTGERQSLMDIPVDGLLVKDGGTVCVQFVELIKHFERGSLVRFSTRELAEICWFFQREAHSALMSAVEYAKNNGIYMEVKSNQ